MKQKRKIISNILCGILILAMLIGTILLFWRREKNEVTFLFDRAVVWIVSPSMEDQIEERSYILVKRVEDPKQIAIDDVILFYSDDPMLKGQLNTHRVKGIIGDHAEFVTKGDNNPVNDAYTAKADQVVGIYVENLPTLTAIVRFFLTKTGFFVIILAFLALTAAMCVPDFVKHFKEQKAEAEAQKEAERARLIAAEVERLRAQDAQNCVTQAEETPNHSASDEENTEI